MIKVSVEEGKKKLIHKCRQIDGETRKTVTDFIVWGSKITADGDRSHRVKRCLFLEEKL